MRSHFLEEVLREWTSRVGEFKGRDFFPAFEINQDVGEKFHGNSLEMIYRTYSDSVFEYIRKNAQDPFECLNEPDVDFIASIAEGRLSESYSDGVFNEQEMVVCKSLLNPRN